ncbi:POK9 protein, partial [Origma solitaria]|nr:POK9 protein [Origma solitaria]
MAAAFATMRGPPAASKVCFNCGKPGHFKKDCSVLKRNNPKTIPVCPRCHKGPHPANQSRSEYDSEGRLLQGCQGNCNQSVESRRHALTQMPQPPSQISAPQMPLQMPASQMPKGNLPHVFA